MYEHTTRKAPLHSLLDTMYKDGYRLAYFDKETSYSIWDKQIKKTNNITIDDTTPQREEFIKEYRLINSKGSYTDTLIKKYHEALKENPHNEMMDKLKEYRQHLELYTTKPPLMISTYLNQKRYKDTYEVTKVDYTQKWKDDMLREQKVPQHCIDAIMTENSAWESTHGKVREMTVNVFQAIIDKYYIIKDIN